MMNSFVVRTSSRFCQCLAERGQHKHRVLKLKNVLRHQSSMPTAATYHTSLRDDPNQTWRNRTARILETSPGNLTSKTLNDTVDVILHWSRQHSSEGADNAWKLIQRLVEEESVTRPAVSILDTEVVNGFLHCWAQAGPSNLESHAVLQQLRSFQSIIPTFPVNCQSFNIILDVAIRQGCKDAHIMADSMLTQLQTGPLQPDAILINTAIHAHAKFGSPQSAKAVFDTLKFRTDDASYGALISAYANHGQPQEAEKLLLEIEAPNTHHFSAVLHAWAKSKQPDKCYELFRRVQALQLDSIKVTSVSFGTVISAFASQGRAQEAELLLQELLELHQETSDPELAPSIVECNSVIAAWARSGHPDAVERAESILNRVTTLSATNQDLRPGVESHTALLHAFAQSGRRDAGTKALAILQRMWDLFHAGSRYLKPDVTCYNTVLDCLAKSGTEEAADQAEHLLQSMCERYQQGDPDVTPNAVSYASVINALSRSKATDAPRRAEVLLEEMNQLSHIDGINLRVAYNATLIVWARSNDPDASKHAEALVVKMKQLEQNGDTSRGPDIFTYNALLQNYAMNQQAEKAEALLLWLCKDYLEHSGSIKVDIIAFNTVISAWSRRRDNDAALRAEEIFQKLASVQDQLGIQPDTVTYTSRISAWSSSSDPSAPQRVINILADMQRKFQSGDLVCKPNTLTFNWALTALSKSQGGADIINDAYGIVETMYTMSANGYRDCRPTLNSFSLLLKCISRSRLNDKAKRAWRVLTDMKNQSVNPDLRTLNEVLAACAYSSRYSTDIRIEAFGIALAAFHRICKESQPSPETFSFFFQSAAGLGVKEEIEDACRICCKLGYQTNKYVHRDLQKAAPQFLKNRDD